MCLFNLLNVLHLFMYMKWAGLTPEVGGTNWTLLIYSLKLICVAQKLLYLLFITKLFNRTASESSVRSTRTFFVTRTETDSELLA